MTDRLAGKVVLISGAARGRGAAEARLFADEGASVVIATKAGFPRFDQEPDFSPAHLPSVQRTTIASTTRT